MWRNPQAWRFGLRWCVLCVVLPRPAVRLSGWLAGWPLRLARSTLIPGHLSLTPDIPWCRKLLDLSEAEAVHRKLAGSRGAHWCNWPATLRRLQAAAPGDGQQWFAALPPCPPTDEHATLTRRQDTLFPLQARSRHPGGA